MPPVRSTHLYRRSTRLENLKVIPAFIVPGAVAAGTKIGLPDHAKPAKRIIQAIRTFNKSANGSCPFVFGTAATYVPTDSSLWGATLDAAKTITIPAANAGMPAHSHWSALEVVAAAPGTGQIQLVDEKNIVLGDDTAADDLVLLLVELKP